MTFQDLLTAMRVLAPIYPRAIDVPEGEPEDSAKELILRLILAGRSYHREWSNLEVVNLFVQADKNLLKEIPCKHCGQKM